MSKGTFVDYDNLFPEIQKIVRGYCIPSARAMLGMTCREEQRLVVGDHNDQHDRYFLYMYLAREGDAAMLLRKDLTVRAQKHPAVDKCHYYATKRRWTWHELVESAITGGHLDLLLWLCEHFKYTCSSSGCMCLDRCVPLAVQSRNARLVCYVVRSFPDERRDAAENAATVEALRQNNVALLTELREQYCLHREPNLLWDQYNEPLHGERQSLDNLYIHESNLGFIDCGMALRWFFSHVRVPLSARRYGTWLSAFFFELLSGMVARGFTMDDIRRHIAVELHPILQKLWTKHIEEHCGLRLLAYGLLFHNTKIVNWAMDACWERRERLHMPKLQKAILYWGKQAEPARDRVLKFFGLELPPAAVVMVTPLE